MDNFEEFSTEDEKDHSVGYFLRSKRRKLGNDKEDAKFVEQSLPVGKQRKRRTPILLLPTEILTHILKFIPYEQLSNCVRMVNKRLKTVAEDILSTSFRKMKKRIRNLCRSTLEALQASQDDMEIKCFCRLINMLEIVHFQQKVLMSTIWRYTLNYRYENYKSCMYGGLLLDMYEIFLWKFTHTPDQLYASVISRDYAMPPEVTSIVQMTKTFCLHFEKTNEEQVNTSLMVSGCKLLDLLDSATFAQKDIIYERVTDNLFAARYNYFFSNTWFVALNIRSEKQMTWKQRQRMMHMRVRRILLAHSEMFLQQYHYEREKMMRKSGELVKIRKPSNNVYTGYGDIQDKFFFYGVMNNGAYMQKFHPDDQMNEGEEDVFQEDPEDVDPSPDDFEDLDKLPPYLGLHIDAKISCPVSHAPIEFLEQKFPLDPGDTSVKSSHFENEKFCLRLEFKCPGAKYPRLPTTYLYKFKHTS